MTAVRAVARAHPGRLYVLAVAVLALALCVLANTGVVPAEAVWLIAVPLGPVGLAAGVVLLLVTAPFAAAGDLPVWALAVVDALVLVAVVGVALANVAIASGVRRRAAATPRPAGSRGRVPLAWDRVLGIGGFITAGALFVVLCFVAGFFALLAGGVDVPAPEAQAVAVRTACAVTWIIGLVAAVGGLVLWVAAANRGLAMLRWAVADAVVQTVALVVLFAVTVAESS